MAQLPPCATLGQFAQNQPQKRRCCFPNSRATNNVAKGPPLPSISLCKMYRFATSLDYLLITIGLVCSAIVGLVWPVFYVLLGGLLDDLAGMIPTTTSTSSSASSTSSPAAARLLSEVLGAVAATAAAPRPPGGRPGGGPGGFTPPGGGGGFPVPGGGAVPGGGGLVPPNPFAPAAAGVSPEMEAITQNCLLLLAVAVMGFVAGSLSLSCLMYTTERQCNAVRVAWVRSAFAQDATWYGAHNVHQLGTQMSIDIAEYYKGTGVRLLRLSFATHTHTHTHTHTLLVLLPPPSPHHRRITCSALFSHPPNPHC